jgi:hypothetical protein
MGQPYFELCSNPAIIAAKFDLLHRPRVVQEHSVVLLVDIFQESIRIFPLPKRFASYHISG